MNTYSTYSYMTGLGAVDLWSGKRQTFGSPMMKDHWEGFVRSTGIGALSLGRGTRKVFPLVEEEEVDEEVNTDDTLEERVDEDGSFIPRDCDAYLGEIPENLTRQQLVEIIASAMIRFQADAFFWTGQRTSFEEVDCWKPLVDFWFEKDFTRNEEGKTKFSHLVKDDDAETSSDAELYSDFDRFFDEVRQYLAVPTHVVPDEDVPQDLPSDEEKKATLEEFHKNHDHNDPEYLRTLEGLFSSHSLSDDMCRYIFNTYMRQNPNFKDFASDYVDENSEKEDWKADLLRETFLKV